MSWLRQATETLMDVSCMRLLREHAPAGVLRMEDVCVVEGEDGGQNEICMVLLPTLCFLRFRNQRPDLL